MKKFIKSSLLFATLFSLASLSGCYKGSSENGDKKGQTTNPTNETPTSVDVEYIDGSDTKKATEFNEINASTSQLDSGFYVVNGHVNLTNAIEVKGDADKPVNIILVDGATLTFGTEESPLTVSVISGTGSLCIYGQKEGTGSINIFTKDVKDVVKVGKYVQKGGNVVINNRVTDANVELGTAVFVNNNSLNVEKGLLKLVGNYADGLKASGILVSGGNINITEANISGDAVNSSATVKVERGAQIKIRDVTGNGIVASGDIRLSGKVEVNVEKTAVKSNGVIALQGNNIVAETSSSDLTTHHGVESTGGYIAIDFLDGDKDASLKATDYKVNSENAVYIVNEKRIINSNDEVIHTGSISDLSKINNKVLNPAYSVTFDSVVNGSVSIKGTSATYFRPNTELELDITADQFYKLSDSLVTDVQGTNVNVTQIGEGENLQTKYSLVVPAEDITIRVEFNPQFKGKGTQEDPFRIENLDDWKLLFVGDDSMIASTKYSGLGKAGADIPLVSKYFVRLDADIVIVKNSEVDNTVKDVFRGQFDGNGHTITMNVGSPDAYITGDVSNVDNYNNGSLFQKSIWGGCFKNLILDGYMYVNYQYAAPLVGVAGVTGSDAIVKEKFENIWVKTDMYTTQKWTSSFIGVVYSTGYNKTEMQLYNVRLSGSMNSDFVGDLSLGGLFSRIYCTSTASAKTNNEITIDGCVNEVTLNVPNSTKYCDTVGWLEKYTYFTFSNILFIPQNLNSGLKNGLYFLKRNSESNTGHVVNRNAYYGGSMDKFGDGSESVQINEGYRGYTLSAEDGIELVVLNDNGSMPSNPNSYSGLTVTSNSLKYNNTNYAKEGVTIKLLLNGGSNSENDIFEIAGGSELQKDTTIVNDQEVTYYLLQMPASDVVIGKKSA